MFSGYIYTLPPPTEFHTAANAGSDDLHFPLPHTGAPPHDSPTFDVSLSSRRVQNGAF